MSGPWEAKKGTVTAEPPTTEPLVLEVKPEEQASGSAEASRTAQTPQVFNYVVTAGTTKLVVPLKKPLLGQPDFLALVKILA